MLVQKKKTTIDPAAALATGVVIGAGAALVGAVLKNKKNREKVTQVTKDIKNQVTGYMKDMQKVKVSQAKKEVKK